MRHPTDAPALAAIEAGPVQLDRVFEAWLVVDAEQLAQATGAIDGVCAIG